ncbi:putative uracil-DNA glycosylase [Triangularia verruculosa]|uniref:Uracil-DNA glycosylase n=1 Tax=Triangularia verruculosa TaxID=2587418 RepID=A0AAN6XCA7_9PEZI|nr:putative uracil-DNA glycosylase [Triangularia verruculosa]
MSTLKRKAGAQTGGADAKKVKQGSIMSFFGNSSPATGPTKSSSAAAAPTTPNSSFSAPQPDPAAARFDKAKWVATLTPEQKKLLQLEIDTLDESWLVHLKDEIVTKEFLDLKRFLEREYAAGKKIFPPKEDVYSWSRHTPFTQVRIVIIGQDPYHNHNQAHGLAFSVLPPTPAPPSLKNIYTCLAKDYPSFNPPPNKGGLLTPWAKRGVLMLNTCLTVRAHDANSHSNRGWEKFTQKCIDLVATKRTKGVVFLAWGTPAGKRVLKVDQKRHLVLKSVHPSPLSASRGFFQCGHFRKANEWLGDRYGLQGRVDWALIEGESVLEHDIPSPKPKMEKGEVTRRVEEVVRGAVMGQRLDLNEIAQGLSPGRRSSQESKSPEEKSKGKGKSKAVEEDDGENMAPEEEEEWDALMREKGL